MRELVVAACAALICLSACREKPVSAFSFQGLGGDLTVTYAGPRDAALEEQVQRRVGEISATLNYYSPGSLLTHLNASAHKGPVAVPGWLCRLLEGSVAFSRETGGRFDITYKSEGYLWDIHRAEVPDPAAVRELLPLVGVENLALDCEKNTVAIRREGVKLDLGGIAAGYAADETRRIMEQAGSKDFLVNYTGELVVCGSKHGKPWTVGIRNPLKKEELIKTFSTPIDGCLSISTSGDYERYLEKNGKRYSHIIDPKSGLPVEGAHSVTVSAADCMTADALATALSVGWRDRGFITEMKQRYGLTVHMLTGDEVTLTEY
ncbi:MAG TPA: FAD:protein FMN transferase [bacterium]|nr:FAD:protein FMN transferase [bacterium]